jgi:hypothetical protein
MTVRKYTSRSQQTTLSSAVTSGATVLSVTNASTLLAGTTISAGQTFVVVIDPDTALEEIVEITSASSNNLTVTRAVDMSGASAQNHSSGAVVRHMIIGRDLRESNLHIEATGAYNDGTSTHAMHGLGAADGVVVGTTATQTLTNKTFTTPVVNGATLSGTITSTATVTGGTITGATITGLSSAGMVSSSAAPKDYVDAILVLQIASQTAAATSAASAATSASSAATSASSALASQTAAATSATSAAASATLSAASSTAAATSATNAATSASSAATSASNAATSASSAATSASSALTSQTAAATSASSAATSATAAANSSTIATTQAAAAYTSATSAAASATAASTSATSAAASVTAAATSATSAAASATAASTSASSASASATAANTSATAAATSAASAATSATAAGTSATSASASATTASNSAATATTQATNAATSAASAATSATAAATSATSAAASATSAADSYDSFDDRYLGAKASPPSVDNDGNALLTGALYWNTSVNKMYVWSGSAWAEISSSADIIAYKYTVSAGATSVSGPDDNSLTLSYTVGKEQVYINGVLQVRGSDYTASTGSSITGMAALTANDIVTVLAFTAFSVSNTVPLSTYTAKGAVAVGTGVSTVGTLTVGSNGDALVADSSTSTGLRYQGTIAAGRNIFINGNFDVWQRGTSTASVANGAFLADRWKTVLSGTGITATYSQDTSVPNGNSKFSAKLQQLGSSATSVSEFGFYQPIEGGSVLPLLGKTVTVSFYYRSSQTGLHFARLYAGGLTGGTDVTNNFTVNVADTWEKKSINFSSFAAATAMSVALTAEGAGLQIGIRTFGSGGTETVAANDYFQISQIQLEAGSVATAFQTATGTIQGELAACQRYFIRYAMSGFSGHYYTTTQFYPVTVFPVEMRVSPTFTVSSAGAYDVFAAGSGNVTSAVGVDNTTSKTATVALTTAARTAGFAGEARLKTSETISWSAEL